MKRILGLAFIAMIASASAGMAEECMVNIEPDRDRGGFGDLVFYSFDPHLEVQIETPRQPVEMTFVIAIDGQESSDIMAFPGLDDLALSVAPSDGDIALDLEFIAKLLQGDELTVLGWRSGQLRTFASYELTGLRQALGDCGLI